MKTNRNAPCPCGSGKKYKKCCAQRDDRSQTSSADTMPVAIAAYQQGDYPRALKVCDEILLSFPTHGEALHLSGLILYEQRRLPQAEDKLLKASRALPDDARVHYSLALVEADLNKTSAAKKCCEQALKLEPPAVDANFLLARILDEQGESKRAHKYYNHTIQALPGHAEARFHLANLELHAGNPEIAITHYLTLLENNGARPQIEYNLGIAYQSIGDHERAYHHLDKANKIDPSDTDTLFAMAKLAYGEDETSNGDALLTRALESSPEHIQSLQLQADIAMTRGDRELAITCLRRIAAKQADNISVLHDLGNTLLAYGEAKESTGFLRRALALDTSNIIIASDLAHSLAIHGDEGAMDSVFESLIEKDLDTETVIGKWATLLEKQNRMEKARELLSTIDFHKNYATNSEEACLVSARIHRREKNFSSANDLMKLCAPHKNRKDAYTLNYYFEELGLLDASGEHEQAFNVAQKANGLGSELHQTHYNKETQRKIYSHYKDTFTADWSQSITSYQDRLSEECVQPVFILGFPRTGTSLLEQILSSHPDVDAAGELPWLGNLFHGAAARFLGGEDPWWEALQQCKSPSEGIAAAQEYYLRHISGHASESPRYITDKMPLNVNYLPLIHLLFPHARIIQMRRHPLDICLSVYFTNFSKGNAFAWDLRDTASRLVDVSDWATHCQQQLSMPIYQCHYEELVSNPEGEVKKVLSYLDLPWNEQCLAFHKSSRLTATASYEQVTQPLYTHSVARHRNYLDQLEFLNEELHSLLDESR